MTRIRIRLPEQLGVTLGPNRISAVRLSRRGDAAGRELWSRDLAPPEQDGSWPGLVSALVALREEMDIRRGTLHVALLPPLVQVRRIELPRLGEDTVRQVLRRDVARYFLGAAGPQIIGVTRLTKSRRSPVAYLVAAADAPVIESLFAAAQDAGFAVGSVVPAQSAWEAGARKVWPELERQAGILIVAAEDRLDAVGLERGRVSLIRRFPPSTDPSLVVSSLAEPDCNAGFGVVGPAERRGSLVSALEGRGLRVFEVNGSRPLLESPHRFAALAAGRGRGPTLVPDGVRRERERSARRLSARLLSAAAALLVFAAGIELWGAYRELDSVQSRRAALRAMVADAITVRDQMTELDGRLSALAAAENARSQWARTLVSVAEYLPQDAHLVGFRGDADSLVMEGEAQKAGLVFESLQKAPGVLGVRADAPIRQEARDSGPAVERFTLAARLAAAATPAESTP